MKNFTRILLCVIACACVAPAAGAPLRLGLVSFLGEATNFHALDRGYFADEGLEVEARINHAGFVSLKQLLAGELDIITVAPTPVVFAAMRRQDGLAGLRIIASILESSRLNNIVVVDRRLTPRLQDLVGQRVAMTKGTASEFFWDLAANSGGIDPSSVRKVDLRVSQMAAAAERGEIDAAVAWSPYDEAIVERLGAQALRLPIGRIYTTSWLVLVSPDYLRDEADAVTAYLRALARAEEDLDRAPPEVARSHLRWVESSEEELLRFYQRVDFDLSLTEGLLVSLHQQAEWAKRSGYVTAPIPDLSAYLSSGPLRSVSPGRVRLLQ